jgi:hypothetical protein
MSQSVNSVTFSARHLESALVRDEEDLGEFLKLAPYYMVIEPQAAPSVLPIAFGTSSASDFRQEMPSFEELTGLLNMSARTLRRGWRRRAPPTSASRTTRGGIWRSQC